MKIAIVSDSHDNWQNLKEAIEIANNEGCELLLHAGDLIAPPGIAVLEEFKGNVKFVWGNNEGERMGMTRKFDASEKIELCGDIYEDTVDGVKIFMSHYPKYTELAFKTGEYDLCIYGHTHDYDEQTSGNSLMINPGEIFGFATGTATFIIFNTEDKSVKKVAL